MLRAIANNPNIKERFAQCQNCKGGIQGLGLPLGSKKRKISGDGFLLVGDAAALIDPFTGEGIGNAMCSGMLAAAHIKKLCGAK
jgi:flavin-dependent dehydrogenase